jgi:hypothetical protein
MRLLGYNILAAGFLWFALWCAPSVGPLTRSIAIENFPRYPSDRTYSDKQVQDAIRSVLEEYQRNAHGVMLPATLMLVGGILLGRAGVRNKDASDEKPSA